MAKCKKKNTTRLWDRLDPVTRTIIMCDESQSDKQWKALWGMPSKSPMGRECYKIILEASRIIDDMKFRHPEKSLPKIWAMINKALFAYVKAKGKTK